MPLMRVAAPGMDARGLVTELRTRVMAEVDYRQEAAAQTAFADEFRDDPDFPVPAWSTAPTGCWSPTGSAGLRWRKWPAVAAARPRTGSAVHGPVPAVEPTAGRAAARRPAPGQLPPPADGRLAVLDFGSSLAMPTAGPHAWRPCCAPGGTATRPPCSKSRGPAGLVGGGDVTPEVLLALLDPLLDPLRQETFTFDRAWMRAQTARVSDPRSEVARDAAQATRPRPTPARPTRRSRHRRSALPARRHRAGRAEAAAWLPVLRRPSAGPGTSS